MARRAGSNADARLRAAPAGAFERVDARAAESRPELFDKPGEGKDLGPNFDVERTQLGLEFRGDRDVPHRTSMHNNAYFGKVE
jgi:hypothetical protein